MSNPIKNYFEQEEIWSYNFLSLDDENHRIKDIIANIPDDVKSVLDIGCGNGAFVNNLSAKKKIVRIVGVDISQTALTFVNVEKILGSITEIPVELNSFDLVTCNEVLEHISPKNYSLALSELMRVSRKYIIITVPNNEYLKGNHVYCPKCQCRFHPFLHIRNFNKIDMANIFQQKFVITKISEIGPFRRRLFKPLWLLKRELKKNYFPNNSICPQCGFSNKNGHKNSIHKKKSSYLKTIERFCGKKERKWLLSLYEKTPS